MSKKCEKTRQKKKEKKLAHAQKDEENTLKMKSIVYIKNKKETKKRKKATLKVSPYAHNFSKGKKILDIDKILYYNISV